MKPHPLVLLAIALATAAASAQAPAPATAPAPTAEAPVPVSPARATPLPARTASGAVPASTGVLLNFQNASLNDVLTYLSEAAGFVIVQDAPVTGTVNIVSRQPLNPEEAVDLLNTVLIGKGYAAIRNGRILKIVNRRDAPRSDLAVKQGSNPDTIPRKDEVVIQILPLRYGEAAKLVENLRPLLADNATISANEGSNAIILTDTQTNIHRMAEIIHALDTSVSALSTITVFPLKYADSKEVATIITQLFAPPVTGGQQGGPGGGGRRGGGFPGFGFGGPAAAPGATSDARAAAAHIVAVADEQSNSVVVSASAETVPVIRQMIEQIDLSSTDITDTKIFRLINADAVEMAGTINSLYGNAAGTLSTGNAAGGQRGAAAGANGQRRQGGQPGGQGAAGANGAQSGRALLQSQVTAVGDPRTNSLLVTAAADSMLHIEEIIARLDATQAKRQHVYYHQLQYADPQSISDVLRGMLGQGTSSASNQTSVLQQRSQTGSSLNTSDTSSAFGSGSGRSSR